MTIRGGITVNSQSGRIGLENGSGVVTVNGAGSTWTDSGPLTVGEWGKGTLNITGGGAVSNGESYIGFQSGCTGVVTVDGAGSTWTNSGDLSVGNFGNGSGTLNITRGGTVSSNRGSIGNDYGSTGVVTVDGVDSTWNAGTNGLFVGNVGSGTLNITRGGTVNSSTQCYIADTQGGSGVVTVDGAGSTWTNSYGFIAVGYPVNPFGNGGGSGRLNITGGGTVTADGVWIGSSSLLAIDVGNGSLLNWLTINDGTVRIMAGASPAANATFTPISAGNWSGSGTYQAIGGTWDEGSHVFTASQVQTGTSGTPVTIDLADKQRVLIHQHEDGSGWTVAQASWPPQAPRRLTSRPRP